MAKDFVTPEQYQRGVGKIKKYVDDNKAIVPTNISEFTNDSKYINQIKVLPVEYDRDKMVNVQNLEPHSIYIAPDDIDFLDLGYEGASGKLVSAFMSPNTELLIYTGNKTDKYISFRVGARAHTVYFKTDTESPRMEHSAYYLTPNNGEVYTPKNDYNPATKKYVDDNNFYTYPTILYDDAKLPKGYVDITTLKTNTFYKVPKGVLTGIFDRVCLKAPNDDGTWFKVDDSSNSTGWRGFGGDTISLMTKSDTNITLYTLGINGFAKCLNIQKENGKWSLKQTMPTILGTSNRAEYTPTADYHPTTKKYVDTKVAGIVNSAPETLDTLQELAKALGNDPNFATTVATQIGKKVDKADGMTLTHNDLTNELKANYDAAYAYSQAKHSYNDLTDKPTIPSIAGLATESYVDAKINDSLNSLKIKTITQSDYDSLSNKDPNTLYLITD